jgi:hypothetical protein
MRITYRLPFQKQVVIPDHWPILFMGGTLRVREENNIATAIQIVFTGEPVEFAPHLHEIPDGPVRAEITGRDHRLALVREQIESAIAYLECYYDIDLSIDEIEAVYEGETPDEEKKIGVNAIRMGRQERPLRLTFDMLTRAVKVAETSQGPRFEATLASAARQALKQDRYVDSFRYSFLLIEAAFGEGQSRSAALKTALKSHADFRAIVKKAVGDLIPPTRGHTSDTKILLESSPDENAIIEHLVDKRGFYFHSNRRRKDAWKPDEQAGAEALALLTIGIAHQISQEAAAELFAPKFDERHFKDAVQAGAKLVFEVRYMYREPGEQFSRKGVTRINTPGTKLTSKQTNDIAREFLKHFEFDTPVATLERAECFVAGTDQKIFDLMFSAVE